MSDPSLFEEFEPIETSESGWFDGLFDIDVRSLAVLRVFLGLLVIYEVWGCLANQDCFFSESGIATIDQIQTWLGDGWWSLYFIDGSPSLARMLMILTLITAACMTVGLRTRVMTFICLVLIWSLQVRDPLILNGGHILLRMLLFWSLFLPMSAVWSLDERLGEYADPERWRERSVCTAAIMLQMAFMYYFSGLAKCNPAWTSGEAVGQVFEMDMYVKPMGAWLNNSHPWVTKIVTWVVLGAETLGPVLLFGPKIHQAARGFFMALFLLMHLGIWLTLDAGIFPLVAAAGWVIFIPTQVWDLVHFRPSDCQDPYEKRFTVTNVLCTTALLYVAASHILTSGPMAAQWQSSGAEYPGRVAMITQEFKLFGEPPVFNPSYQYQATLADNSKVEIFSAMYSSRPENPSPYEYFGSQQWRRIHSNLSTAPDAPVSPEIQELREQLLQSVVDQWNNTHGSNQFVKSAELTCVIETINDEDAEPVVQKWANWTDAQP
ncbi:MAG: HTTM domain-containing protein [Planctomycetota bacterium]